MYKSVQFEEPMDLLIAYRTVESKNHKHKDKKDHKKDGKGMVEREGEKKKEKRFVEWKRGGG